MICKDCGETLTLGPEGLWLPKRIEGMGRSCRIRAEKLCAQPEGARHIPPPRDPFNETLVYPRMNRA